MRDFLRDRSKSEHQWVGDSLSAYLDGELSTRLSARVEKHLRECRACTRNLSTLRQTVALVNELPVVPAPRSFAIPPAVVQPKAKLAAPRWGYGFLRGATALAALLVVLLIGADVSLRFLGGFRFAASPPPAPGGEMLLALEATPTIGPLKTSDQLLTGQAKETEPPGAVPPPSNFEELPAPSATQAPPEHPAVPPQGTATSERSLAAEANGTPPAVAAAGGTPSADQEAMGAGAAEPTSTLVPTPTLKVEATGQAEPSPAPTATPQVVAMADRPQPWVRTEDAGFRGQLDALSPLRLAELVAVVILAVLICATLVSGWLIRKRT